MTLKKFASIHRRKAPSGSPNIPPEVQLVKKFKKMIDDRALLGGGNEVYDMDGGGSFVSEAGDMCPHIPVASVLFLPSISPLSDSNRRDVCLTDSDTIGSTNFNNSAAFVTPDSSGRGNRSTRGRSGNSGGGKKPDPITLMMIHMR